MDDDKVIMVESPEYNGPERRDRLVIGPCGCHPKHQRILEDHDKKFAIIEAARERRGEHMEQAHGDIYEEIKKVERSRVPNRIFYLFVTVYSGLFILGIVSVYSGMHQNALAFQKGLSDVKVMQAELKATAANTGQRVGDMKDEIRELKRDLKDRMKLTPSPTTGR